jgi:hypothetical protein
VVNPAPPSGSAARKEAKQRQAATAKSEEGASEGGSESANIELADKPSSLPGASMTRHRPDGPHPFTALGRAGQPSAWSRDLLYGGSIGLAALVLAFGFTVLRPRPRRRPPTVAAPAWVPGRSRRRP